MRLGPISVGEDGQLPLCRSEGRFSYISDGFATVHSVHFMAEPGFAAAYAVAAAAETSRGLADPHVEWRVAVALWAARHALARPGDFVECGVNSGILAGAVCTAVDFARETTRRFWLVDTFKGIPPDQFSTSELAVKMDAYVDYYGDTLEFVRRRFSAYPNVVIVPGRVPQILSQVTPEAVAYLSIDMNAAAPELAAARHFWPRMVPGAVMLLDDYGWPSHDAQRIVFDHFSAEVGAPLLRLPTGQALMVKS